MERFFILLRIDFLLLPFKSTHNTIKFKKDEIFTKSIQDYSSYSRYSSLFKMESRFFPPCQTELDYFAMKRLRKDVI